MNVVQTIDALNRYFSDSTPDIVKYNLNTNYWWRGKHAILLKRYINLEGGVIEKGAIVLIKFKMQKPRFNYFIHTGEFYVTAVETQTCIGGVYCTDLILTVS